MRIKTNNQSNIFVYKRELEGQSVLVVLNLKGVDQEFIVEDAISGSYKEIFTQEEKTFDQTTTMKLEPWGYRVFVNK